MVPVADVMFDDRRLRRHSSLIDWVFVRCTSTMPDIWRPHGSRMMPSALSQPSNS